MKNPTNILIMQRAYSFNSVEIIAIKIKFTISADLKVIVKELWG